MTRSQEVVAQLQGCLALEHEAIWVYAYLGARVKQADDAAHRAFGNHRYSRDKLLTMLAASGASQPSPLASYAVDEAKNLDQAARIARSIEAKSAAAYLDLVGQSTGKDREFAINTLRKAALASLVWLGKPTPFPGLPS